MFTSNLILVLVIYFTFCEGAIVSFEQDSWYNFDTTCLTDPAQFFLSGAGNRYYLYTRKNPNVPQKITYGNKGTLVKSNYDARKDLIVIVHGWGGHLHSPVNEVVKASYLKAADVNVIVLDWGIGHENYLCACLRVPGTGRYLGNFVQWVLNTADGDWDRVHLIGYSLGAHIVGNAGREVGGLPRRVTGLDPAGPLWGFNPYALNTESGQYVEIIHTNVVGRGILKVIGHVDFYPNGGRMQPGCNEGSCAHDRAYTLFASSLENNHLVGRRCTCVLMALVGGCFGDTLAMGNTDLSKAGSGIYYLSTKASWPF